MKLNTLYKFWELDNYKRANTICLDSEEEYCEKLFRETYRRQPVDLSSNYLSGKKC